MNKHQMRNNSTIAENILKTYNILYKDFPTDLYSWRDIVYKATPNLGEAFSNVFFKVAIESHLSRVVVLFGQNPTATAVIRDVIKLGSTAWNVYIGESVGHSKYVYDGSHLYSGLYKALCKGAIITGGAVSLGTTAIPTASRVSNIVCDSTSRGFIVAGREKQEHSEYKDSSFLDFFWKEFNVEWFTEGAVGAGFKVAVVDHIGEIISYFSLTNRIRYLVAVIEAPLVNRITGQNFIEIINTIHAARAAVQIAAGTYRNEWDVDAPTYRDLLNEFADQTLTTKFTLFFAEFVPRFVAEMFITIVLTTPSRMIFEAAHKVFSAYDSVSYESADAIKTDEENHDSNNAELELSGNSESSTGGEL